VAGNGHGDLPELMFNITYSNELKFKMIILNLFPFSGCSDCDIFRPPIFVWGRLKNFSCVFYLQLVRLYLTLDAFVI